MSAKKVATGFFVAPLISSILYAAITGFESNFFLTLIAAIIIAYMITLIIMLPVYLIIRYKYTFNFQKVALLSFGLVFVIFLSYLIYTGSNSINIVNGSKIIVASGQITLDGYIYYLMAASKIALFSLFGGLIFYFFAKHND